MSRSSKSQSSVAESHALETLIALSHGEIDVATAASLLNQTEEESIGFVESHPTLVHEAETIAKRQRLDPEKILERSSSGLAAAISVLATRIENHGPDMTTSELVQASSLLEKLIALSEQSKAEIKGASGGPDKADGTHIPIVIQDTRPCPISGKPRLAIYAISPGHPHWVDFSNPNYQSPRFNWLEHFLPLSPETGKPLNLTELTQHTGARFMDETGRIFGGSA